MRLLCRSGLAFLCCLLSCLPAAKVAYANNGANDVAIDGQWRNIEDNEQLKVMSRFDFSPGIVKRGALVLERYPPACTNAALQLEFGPSDQFNQSMGGQQYQFRFAIDHNPARIATFTSHSQQRVDGNYLLLQLTAMSRASTLLSEMSSGQRLTIRSINNALNTSITIPMTQTAKIIRGGIDACIRQAYKLDERTRIR
ncbi:hypothetical protein IC617_15715 [Neiella sp. HB171785]|uniref:DUF642 domain-containing protein n=1 Tax=Neiella litorisoli TaxID=2771431 RepID=A0A8J6QV48_9GAMM|nr:hypothetical protein [Neiella litorisoli]MBD1390877.1 hypothetical protein [Neiella litorisoli]